MGAFVQRNGSRGGGRTAPAQILRGRARVDQGAAIRFAATQELLRQTREERSTIKLAPVSARKAGAVGGSKLAALECAASGGELVLGRCVQLGARPVSSRVEGGPVMGIRAQLISPGFLPTAGSGLLGGLIQEGFGLLNTFVSSKFGQPGVPSLSPSPLASTQLGGLIPTGGPVGMAAISAAIVAAGGAIVGTVIRISRGAWASIPSLIKQAAVAVGLTVAFTDVGLDLGGGGGGGLSNAQLAKIDKFQAMTSAGVPPGIAARATGIGRKRRRGLSFFELRGFRKISHMLSHVGMVPRGLRGARPRAHHHHK